MDENLISVSQFSNYVKNIFDAEILLQDICIFGEISSFNVSNGVAYFGLKDENALLNCVMFRYNEKPNVGDMVIVKGSPNYYVKGGRFSFNVTKIMPYGKGLLYENFLKLKEKLEKLGYFDQSIKKPIPERVKRIGVVSSPTGAVIQDIIDITTRRNNSVDIVLFPVKVQGIGAEFEIAKGIDFFSNYDDVDCVIVARGGGSMEDLQPFNTEVVADATYRCKKPLVSAVGHETDFTIIDFCSDLRAPTPSAAAELVVREKKKDFELIDDLIYNIEQSLNLKIKNAFNKVDLLANNLNKEVLNLIKLNSIKFLNITNKLNYNVNNLIVKNENKFKLLENMLNKLSPLNLINKGYIKANVNGSKLKSCKEVDVGSEINIELIDGTVLTKVLDIKGEK